jgi:hypothetical protein
VERNRRKVVGGDGLVVQSWLAMCLTAQGSRFESQRGHLSSGYHHGGGITGRFCSGVGFPSCHNSIYRANGNNFRGSACVSEWMLVSVKKDGGLVFHNLNGCIRTIYILFLVSSDKSVNEEIVYIPNSLNNPVLILFSTI